MSTEKGALRRLDGTGGRGPRREEGAEAEAEAPRVWVCWGLWCVGGRWMGCVSPPDFERTNRPEWEDRWPHHHHRHHHRHRFLTPSTPSAERECGGGRALPASPSSRIACDGVPLRRDEKATAAMGAPGREEPAGRKGMAGGADETPKRRPGTMSRSSDSASSFTSPLLPPLLLLLAWADGGGVAFLLLLSGAAAASAEEGEVSCRDAARESRCALPRRFSSRRWPPPLLPPLALLSGVRAPRPGEETAEHGGEADPDPPPPPPPLLLPLPPVERARCRTPAKSVLASAEAEEAGPGVVFVVAGGSGCCCCGCWREGGPLLRLEASRTRPLESPDPPRMSEPGCSIDARGSSGEHIIDWLVDWLVGWLIDQHGVADRSTLHSPQPPSITPPPLATHTSCTHSPLLPPPPPLLLLLLALRSTKTRCGQSKSSWSPPHVQHSFLAAASAPAAPAPAAGGGGVDDAAAAAPDEEEGMACLFRRVGLGVEVDH